MKLMLLTAAIVLSGCSAMQHKPECEKAMAPPSELVRRANVGGVDFIALPLQSLVDLINERECLRNK